MAADALAPCIARASENMEMDMQLKRAPSIIKEEFQLPVTFQVLENKKLCYIYGKDYMREPTHLGSFFKPEIPSFDLYMGPLVHPTNRNRFTACPSVRPSGEVSGHLPENAWRDWPEILHADVSWPSSELISLWPRSVDFAANFGAILT